MNGVSEWQAYREMKSEIAAQTWVNDGIMFPAVFIVWAYGAHTKVKAKDKIV